MTFPAHLRTSTALNLAEQIRGGRWHLCPILADALEDAGADGTELAPLRDGIADSRSGLWLAGVRWDGLWELGQLNTDLEAEIAIHGDCGETTPSGIAGVVRAGCHVCQLRSRRTELKDLHTGPCPRCGGRKRVQERGSLGMSRDCPTCVLTVRERWDECRCEKCKGDGGSGEEPCQVCGGSGDLLQRHHEGRRGTRDVARPISFDLGPLPVVSVRLEEMVREEPCNIHRGESCTCSGTGVIHVPSEWLRALPSWYDVAIDGVEPLPDNGGVNPTYVGWHPRRNVPLWLWELIESPHRHGEWKDYLSPAAAHAALRQGLRRWRYA